MRQLIPILLIWLVIVSGCSSPEPKPLTSPQQETTAKPSFQTLKEAVSFISACLDKEDYQQLREACINDISPANVLEGLKAINAKTPLTELYAQKEFPKEETTFKLGGHRKELGNIHLDFIKKDNAWYIDRIWACR